MDNRAQTVDAILRFFFIVWMFGCLSVFSQSTKLKKNNKSTKAAITTPTVTSQNLNQAQEPEYPYVPMMEGRWRMIEDRLLELSKKEALGLKEKIDFSISGASIHEFLRAIAETHNLNVSIDPNLNFKVIYNFNNEKVMNVILFLCREYNLDIRFTGSIMSFYKFEEAKPEPEKVKPKAFNVEYNSYNDKLSADLRKDTLTEVIKKIIKLSKKNVTLAPGLENKLVSGYIEAMPFEQAVERLAYANNMLLEKSKEGNLTLEPNEVEYEQTTSTKAGDVNFSGVSNDSRNARGSKSNTTSKSKTRPKKGQETEEKAITITDSLGKKWVSIDADNLPVAELVKSMSEDVGKNFYLFSDPKGNITTKINKAPFDDVLSVLLQGTDHTWKNRDNTYLIGERGNEGFRESEVVQLQYRSAEIMLDNIPSDLKKGVDIKYFKELNSLIMSGSAPQIAELKLLIKKLDRLVPVIQLEAIFVNVSKSRTSKTGISAGFRDTVKSGGNVLGANGLDYTFNSRKFNELLAGIPFLGNAVNIGKINSSFYLTLSALESQGDVDVKQTPKLSTLNGHEATLKIGETDYYSIETQNTLGSLTTNTIKTIQWNQIQANLSIKINPIVSGDDQVTMDIEFENSSFKPRTAANAPVGTFTQTFKSMIRVKNEEMIVLGGLEGIQKSESGSGIPFLSRIPILKWLFSSREKTKKKSKLLVFIRPTIIY